MLYYTENRLKLWRLPDAFTFYQLEWNFFASGRNPVDDRLVQTLCNDLCDLLEILPDRRDRRSEKLIEKEWFQAHQGNIFRDADAVKDLTVIKDHFKELADLHMMKESLRSIYRVVENPWAAEVSLGKWCKQSLSLDSAYLGKMVKCLRQHWEGVLGFWKYDNLTNAGMEGFNNKVRTMIRQAYGFRDEEYMRLKIFDLPNKRVNDGI